MAEEGQDLSTGGVLSTAGLGAGALGAPIRGFRFTATFEGLGTASFKSVEGFRIEIGTLEYREGAFGRLTMRKVPGLVTYGDITLTKGVYSNIELYDFFHGFLVGVKTLGVNAIIRVFDAAGDIVASWTVIRAWPISIESTGLNADSSEILIETVVLVNEGVFRDAVPQP
ncbi:MAG: phage tail protein [Firmicutes bacterium]|nr:phage tail protein [Bacillota bacterium]